MATQSFDLAVLGGGPGGYVAAIRASQLGLKVAVIERENIGGVCVNWGCIPTKALLHNAEVVEGVKEGNIYGFTFDNLKLDYSVAQKRSREVSNRMMKGGEFLMKKNKIQVIKGTGQLTSPTTLKVQTANGEETVEAKYIIVATGAKPRTLPFLPVDGKRVFTYRQLLEYTQTPKSMIVVGSGAIGMEFATVFHAYGAQVTVLEVLPRILPNEDEDISAEMAKAFAKKGIKTMAGVKVDGATIADDGVTINISANGQPQQLKADIVLQSVGIAPLTEGIGLDKAGVAVTDRGFITVDDTLKTNVANVYAIGDLTGKLALAHVASAQGIIAAEAIGAQMGKFSGHLNKLNYDAIPRCTYSHPEVASMGLTEAQAKDKGFSIKVSKFPFQANGKAVSLNDYTGFIKVIADAKFGEILGVHIIGPRVTELLPEYVLAKNQEMTAEQIMHSVHAHPTLTEVLGEVAEGIEGLPIHI